MVTGNIITEFESTGTRPYNRKVSTELDFALAKVTDRLLSAASESQHKVTDKQAQSEKEEPCCFLQTFSAEHSAVPISPVDLHQYVSLKEICNVLKASTKKNQ